jgi:hypothetical protein
MPIFSDWLERRRLVRKGLACDKTRLVAPEESLQGRLEGNWITRLAILGVFLVLLHIGVAWGHMGVLEDQLLAFIVFLGGLMLLDLNNQEILKSNSKIVLVLGAVWFNLIIIKELYLILSRHNHEALFLFYFLSPCVFAPLLITLLLGARPGLFAVVQTSMLASLLVGRDFKFLLISLLAGFTAVYFTRSVRKRADLIRAGVAVGAVNLLCAVSLGMILHKQWGVLGWQVLIGFGASLVTAMIVSAILPLVEGAFQITTTISWIELADLNHPLLQQMTLEAPGTYHHSLIVANLAEAGAKAIKVDPTPCRVMAYFHDIGKIIKPEYFTENVPPGANPHENLSPSMSALIIIAHVKEGIDLALKYRLKRQVLDAIQQHHGDTIVHYFHQRALQQQRDAREGGKIMHMREEDVPEVSENSFRYPGPRPQTREIALLMMADSVEAASRSLEKPTPQRIEDLVNEIVAHKIADHQFDECHLTLNEIRAAAEAMAMTVKNMMHSRISYARKEKSASTVVQPTKRNSAAGSSAPAAA